VPPAANKTLLKNEAIKLILDILSLKLIRILMNNLVIRLLILIPNKKKQALVDGRISLLKEFFCSVHRLDRSYCTQRAESVKRNVWSARAPQTRVLTT
jgi:hypothetical protein